jgi:hypothetical protein
MRTTEYVYRIANPIMLKKRHCKCRLTGENMNNIDLKEKIRYLKE